MSSMAYRSGHYINGTLVQGGQDTFQIKNPDTNELVATLAIASREEVDAAVAAAKAAQPGWMNTPAMERARILRRFAELLAEHAAELGELDRVCMGKPAALHADDVAVSVNITNYYSGLVETALGQTSLGTPDHLCFSLRQPFGVVAGIVPWNFPAMHWCFEFVPACGAGNAMIIKTSEKSPLSGLLLNELATKAGVPPGIINTVTGTGSTGALLASHMEIRRISFTGSTGSGRKVMEAAARSNLKDVALELGGKSPLLIFEDADLESAAKEATFSITYNVGQVCIASSRVLVQNTVAEKFRDLLRREFENLHQGKPDQAGVRLGPQADDHQAKSVQAFLEQGRKDGKVLIGGSPAEDIGPNFIQPTVFYDVEEGSRTNSEEIFGPVLVVNTFTTEEEALSKANATEYGLYASVFSNNIGRAIRVAKGLEAGNVGVNCTSPFGPYDLPFGGTKASGIGKQKGSRAVLEWLEEKSVFIRLGSSA